MTSRYRELSDVLYHLRGQAVALTGTAEGPVDVLGVSRRCGATITIEASAAPGDGSFVWRDGQPTLVVRRRSSTRRALSARERFTLAHELGHWLVERDLGFRPQSRGEYWTLEQALQSFAHRLLLPHALVAKAVAPVDDAVALLDTINTVASMAIVSAEPAVRAVLDHLDQPAAAGLLVHDPYRATGRLGFRWWWFESRRWIGGDGLRRLAIREEEALSPGLAVLRELRPGARVRLELSGADDAAVRRRRIGRQGAFVALLTS